MNEQDKGFSEAQCEEMLKRLGVCEKADATELRKRQIAMFFGILKKYGTGVLKRLRRTSFIML